MGTIQAVKKSAGANKAACATQFIVFMAVFAADTLSSRRTDAFPHGGMLATAAFAWRENVVLVRLERHGRVAGWRGRGRPGGMFRRQRMRGLRKLPSGVLLKPGRPPFRRDRVDRHSCQSGPRLTLARTGGWPGGGWLQLTVAPSGSNTGALRSRRAMGSQAALSASLTWDFRAHRRFPFLTSLAAPRSTGRELCRREPS